MAASPLPTNPRKRRSRTTAVTLGVIAAAVLAVGSGAIGYVLGSSGSTDTNTATPQTSQASFTTTTASVVPVTASDFSMSVLVEEKKCFGSAGCNVTVSVRPTFLSSISVLEGRTFKVMYEIDGGDDPVLDKFTIDSDNISIDDSQLVQTPSSDSEITATVTQVVETTNET